MPCGEPFRFSHLPREMAVASEGDQVALWERNFRDIEDFVSDLPCGGAPVFCGWQNVSVEMSGGLGTYEVEHSLELVATHTVAVNMVAYAISEVDDFAVTAGWAIGTDYGFNSRAYGVLAFDDGNYYAQASALGAFTRDAGTYTIGFSGIVEDPGTASTITVIVGYTLIVGSDTGDNCMQGVS